MLLDLLHLVLRTPDVLNLNRSITRARKHLLILQLRIVKKGQTQDRVLMHQKALDIPQLGAVAYAEIISTR